MGIMFYYCGSFNQELKDWNTSNVTDMRAMFNICPNFNQYIGDWNTSNVTDMSFMFNIYSSTIPNKFANGELTTYFTKNDNTNPDSDVNQDRISDNLWISRDSIQPGNLVNVSTSTSPSEIKWSPFTTGKSKKMIENGGIVYKTYAEMIVNVNTIINRTISLYLVNEEKYFDIRINSLQDISTVSSGTGGFSYTRIKYNKLNWDTSNVTDMKQFSFGCTEFNSDISDWDTSNITDMRVMLTSNLNFNQDLSGWCVRYISNSSGWFEDYIGQLNLQSDYYPVWGTCPRNEDGQGKKNKVIVKYSKNHKKYKEHQRQQKMKKEKRRKEIEEIEKMKIENQKQQEMKKLDVNEEMRKHMKKKKSNELDRDKRERKKRERKKREI